MVFPLRKENSINGLIMAILENNDTSLRYTVLEESQKGYTEILQRFLAVDRENDRPIHIPSSGKFPPGSSPVALAPPIKTHGISINDNGNGDIDREGDGGSSGPVKEIREVTITVPKVPSPPVIPPPLPQDIKLPPVGPGGGCEMYENCPPYRGGGGGSPTPDQNLKDPCSQIKSNFTNERFKAKFQKLTNPDIFKLDHEMGSFERYPPKENKDVAPAFADVENYIGTTDMDLPADKNGIVGLMHSHNNEDKDGNKPVKIFSPTDVRTFLNVLMTQSNNYTGSYQNAYSVVTTSEGNYMLKYTKDTWPTPADGGKYDLERRDKWNEWYKEKYTDLLDNGELTQENVEKVFTQFLKEVVKVDGLEVYKVTETSSSKLEYNGSKNPVKSTSC